MSDEPEEFFTADELTQIGALSAELATVAHLFCLENDHPHHVAVAVLEAAARAIRIREDICNCEHCREELSDFTAEICDSLEASDARLLQ